MNLRDELIRVNQNAMKLVDKRTPELLIGAGIVCWITTTIAAVKVTPKAAKLIEEKKKELNTDKLNVKEKVKTVGKLYLFPVTTGVLGSALLVASVNTSNKRYIALSTSYELAKETARTYREKVIETLGEKKEEKIRNSIAQDNVDNEPPTKEKTVIIANNKQTLFKESLTGQYFYSDVQTVKHKALEFANRQLNSPENYVGVHEWLDELGEGQIDVPERLNDLGWSISDQQKVVTIELEAVVAHKFNDEPCLVIGYNPLPVSDYYIYWH